MESRRCERLEMHALFSLHLCVVGWLVGCLFGRRVTRTESARRGVTNIGERREKREERREKDRIQTTSNEGLKIVGEIMLAVQGSISQMYAHISVHTILLLPLPFLRLSSPRLDRPLSPFPNHPHPPLHTLHIAIPHLT